MSCPPINHDKHTDAKNTYDSISQCLLVLRAWAIIWIVAYHLMGNTQGYLVLEDALNTLSKGGFKNIVESGLALFISAGSTGVNVFLIISGFGLTASWWKKYGAQGNIQMPLTTFWQKRMLRIVPQFWVAVLLTTLLYFINPAWAPFGQSIWQAGGLSPLFAILTTLTTLRNVVADHYYFLNGAWWYVGLSIQLYLVFPWLIQLGSRYGWFKLLSASLLFSLSYRAIFLIFPFPPFPISNIGTLIPLAFFPSRLFEFVFGIYLAIILLQPQRKSQQRKSKQSQSFKTRLNTCLKKLLLKPQYLPISICLFLIGLSFKWLPYPILKVFSEALIGVGLFCSLVALAQFKPLQLGQIFRIIGKHSYGIYLIHMNIYLMLWPLATDWISSYWLRFASVMVTCCIIGIMFEITSTDGTKAIGARLFPKKSHPAER